jgi:hypothetical protein
MDHHLGRESRADDQQSQHRRNQDAGNTNAWKALAENAFQGFPAMF